MCTYIICESQCVVDLWIQSKYVRDVYGKQHRKSSFDPFKHSIKSAIHRKRTTYVKDLFLMSVCTLSVFVFLFFFAYTYDMRKAQNSL